MIILPQTEGLRERLSLERVAGRTELAGDSTDQGSRADLKRRRTATRQSSQTNSGGWGKLGDQVNERKASYFKRRETLKAVCIRMEKSGLGAVGNLGRASIAGAL